jgi:Ca2+-binding EF-hand superfamily protein/predicted esterase
MNDDGNGYIEFAELKMALSVARTDLLAKEAETKKKKELRKQKTLDGRPSAAENDVAGTGEQDFGEGMQRAAEDRDAADKDIDNKLDFGEFCELVRGREEGDIPDEELKVRFELLDVDKTGKIEMHEYLIWSLKDCLARASTRLVVIFQKWDEDGNGAIDEAEFYRAVRALGMPVDREDTDAVFKLLDADGSGTIQYKELNEKLRQGIGSELAKRNLSRAPPKPDRSRTAKLNAKNVNMNYTTARVAALPETVKLDASSGVSVQEQLREILKANSVKLVDLFADWDEDGNGGLDKKEFRKGIIAMGYDAPNKDIDAIFDSMNGDGNGFIEFEELKVALSDARIKIAAAEKAEQKRKQDGTGDKEGESKLDVAQFSILVKAREEGKHTEEELKARFDELDVDKTGWIEMAVYLSWSLKDCIARASTRLVDIFLKWDEDKSGSIDKVEFYRAVKSLGFPVSQADTDIVFKTLDEDGSGNLEYKELSEKLRQGLAKQITQRKLKRGESLKADRSRTSKLTAKNVNTNYIAASLACLPETVKLDAKSGKPITEQLREILKRNSVMLIDLFREWDDDGNGALDRKEWRKGFATLGYDAPQKDVDAIFDSMNENGDGFVEFGELKKALSDVSVNRAAKQDQAAAELKKRKSLKQASKKDVGEGKQLSADVTDDKSNVDFEDFCILIKAREEGNFKEEELKARFEWLDVDKSGQISMHTYLMWSLKDCLTRASTRLVDLFKKWDEDKSGTVDKNEFFKAVRALGFPVEQVDTDEVFKSLDIDGSGSLEYSELVERLRAGIAKQLTLRNLKRAPGKVDRSRTGKLTARAVNMNYVVAHTAALGETVKLDASGGKPVVEQLSEILKKNSVALIDLFREWDDDGNGALDRKEWRKGIAALGYDAPKKDIDAIFDSMNEDGNGFVEFEELKTALSGKRIRAKAAEAKVKEKRASLGGNKGQGSLDFEEFCIMVRGREEGDIPAEELKARFEALAPTADGMVTMAQYLTWSLKDGLMRSSQRLVDLFRAWDEDGNGKVDAYEFYKAIRALGFPVEESDTNLVFKSLDADGSGQLEYAELNEKLRAGVGKELTLRNLRRAPKKADRSITAKVTNKNLSFSYQTAAIAALKPTVQLDPESGVPLQEQLRDVLRRESVKLIDLFREWDEDGNGGLDKKEFRRGVAALGYKLPAAEIDAVFDTIDSGAKVKSANNSLSAGGGENNFIEFSELRLALSDHRIKLANDAADARALAEGKRLPSELRKEREASRVAFDAEQGASRFQLPPLVGAKQQQLSAFLAMNNIKVLELFREWDKDGNGMLDKHELRRAVKTLGFVADVADCDAIFEAIDESGDGQVDFDEMKRALNSFLKGRMPTPRSPSRSGSGGGMSGISTPSSPTRRQAIAFQVEAAAKILANLRKGEDAGELIFEPHGEHTHTVVMLHPEVSTAEGVYGRLGKRFLSMSEHIKFVFPRVPLRDGSPFWFLPPRTREGNLPAMHFYIQPDDEEADAFAEEQLQLQTERLHAILEREAAILRGDTQRLVVGGTAQGGSVALHAAMKFRAPLGALLCLRTAPLLKFTVANSRLNQTPIFIFAGGRDSVCPLTHMQEAFAGLSKGGYKLEWHVEPGLGHTAESLNEQRYVAYWVARASLSNGSKAADANAISALRAALVVPSKVKSEDLMWSLSPRPYVGRPGTMMAGLPTPGSVPQSSARKGFGSEIGQPLSAIERVPHPPASPAPEQPNTSRGRNLGELPHTHSRNARRWGGRSTLTQDSAQRSKVSYTTDAEMLYPLPGTKSFIRGLRRATDQGAYIPYMYLEPAQAATPHRAGRVGVSPLERQPEWRNWELFF